MSQAQAVSGAPAVRASDAERDQAAEILRAGYTEGRLSRALAELEAAELVHAANGAVSVVYPFSGAPTRQQVELDGFPAVYAMCAIDALGIPAMAGRGSGPPRSTARPSWYRSEAVSGGGPGPRPSWSSGAPATAAPTASPDRRRAPTPPSTPVRQRTGISRRPGRHQRPDPGPGRRRREGAAQLRLVARRHGMSRKASQGSGPGMPRPAGVTRDGVRQLTVDRAGRQRPGSAARPRRDRRQPDVGACRRPGGRRASATRSSPESTPRLSRAMEDGGMAARREPLLAALSPADRCGQSRL